VLVVFVYCDATQCNRGMDVRVFLSHWTHWSTWYGKYFFKLTLLLIWYFYWPAWGIYNRSYQRVYNRQLDGEKTKEFISLCYHCHCHWDNFLRTVELLWVTSNLYETVLGLPAGHCHFTFIIWPFRLQCGHRQLGFCSFQMPIFDTVDIICCISYLFRAKNIKLEVHSYEWIYVPMFKVFKTVHFRQCSSGSFFQYVCFHCMF